MEEKRYLQRKAKALKCDNFEQVAINCNHLGNLYNQQGLYKKALLEYQQEAGIYGQLDKKLEMAKAHRMAGEMYMMLCEFESSMHHIQLYLATVQKLHHKVEEQRAYTTIGRLYLLMSQSNSKTLSSELLEKAEKSFVKSLQMATELSDQTTKIEQYDMQARSYLNIGIVKENIGDYEKSLHFMKEALKISKDNDLFELTHLCYISMSLLFADKMKDFTQALNYCNMGLETAKRLPNKVKKLCETLITKSEILIKEGDFSSAKQILTKAYKKNTPDANDKQAIAKSLRIVLKICRAQEQLITTDADDFAKRKKIFEALGDACCLLHNYEQAIEYYLQMLESAKQNGECAEMLIPIYVSLYQTYKDIQQYDKALEFLWKEYELVKNEPKEACTTLCEIAEVYEAQAQPFWTTFNIYKRAKQAVMQIENILMKKIVFKRLYKFLMKNNMKELMKEIQQEANDIDIILKTENAESEDDESASEGQENISVVSDDFNLDELSDSEASDLDEVAAPTTQTRTSRSSRCFSIKRNNKGETLLHQACIAGNFELVSHLINQGHTINIRDHAGWLPLHEACNHGYTNIVKLLLDHGAAIAINDKGGTSCDGITPLHDACSNGYLDTIELLLERGADPTLKSDFGETCLDALDKWRRSVNLNVSEQLHYETVRQRLFEPLSKLGICKDKSVPMNNAANVIGLLDNNESSSDIENMFEHDFIDMTTENQNYSSADAWTVAKKQKRALPAPMDYKKVIEQMKHPNRRLMAQAKSTDKHPYNKAKSNATYETEMTEFNDFYEEDMQIKKKRRHNINEYDAISSSSAKNVIAATQIKHFAKRELSKRKSMGDERNFSTDTNCSALTEINSASTSKENANSFTVACPGLSQIAMQATPLLLTTISFKVKVEQELLLVPIERNKIEDTTIRALAEEVAGRYYNIVGIKPILRLKTVDGFTYEENDAVMVALEQNILLGTVIDWEIKSLEESYINVCSRISKNKSEKVLAMMVQADTSQILQLAGFWLKLPEFEPIFKTIYHQNSLRVLDFSNNILRDEGCREFAKCLDTLSQLKSLNLKANLITARGLEILFNTTNARDMHMLEELNLSQNPLGNKSVFVLEKFCNKAASLRKLLISDCELSDLNNCYFCFHQLEEFAISFNRLSVQTLCKLLNRLDVSRMQTLDLSYTCATHSDDQARDKINENLVDFFHKNSCSNLKCLLLSGCQLTDSSVYQIAQCLKAATDLSTLEINDNASLTASALKFIFEIITLRKLSTQNCLNLLQETRLTEFYEFSRLPAFWSLTLPKNHTSEIQDVLSQIWQQQWGQNAKIKFYNSGLVHLHIAN